ncbi:hypothetical protein CC80DRAFT_490952 [Byssothecium circinans]|uniref:Aminoglycoside phosphotransferase domain-containing protein n=1 Tax=Byssothecium circinans TaxID=147558 RepID=A0A6A5U0H0_9PLEO|nr:hypothetical protein CC80DRAFT_490952 [Byssothecium circinans]
MPPPPLHSPSSKATEQNSRIIWAPSIPSIDWSELLQTISLHGILVQASGLRECKAYTFVFDSDSKPFSGSQSIIFVVGYADGVKYAFRLPYHLRKSKLRDRLLSNELEQWEAFVQSRIPLVPRVVGYSLSIDNPIGFPFIAYEWVEGKPLSWNDYEPQNTVQREKIIKSLALFTINTACRLQKPGETTTEVYVTQAIDRKIKRVLKGQLRTAKLVDCLRQRSLIRKYMIPELDSSPWVMVHGDLSGPNIITDTEYNISGIIDFGFAEYVPLQFAAVFPRILDHESYQDQDDIDIAPELSDDPESSLVWRSKNSETKRRDRQIFLETVKGLCDTHGEICRSFYRVLNSKEEIRRYWRFVAISNQKLHQVMVKVNWLLHDAEWVDENLSNEWKLFQLANSSVVSDSTSDLSGFS